MSLLVVVVGVVRVSTSILIYHVEDSLDDHCENEREGKEEKVRPILLFIAASTAAKDRKEGLTPISKHVLPQRLTKTHPLLPHVLQDRSDRLAHLSQRRRRRDGQRVLPSTVLPPRSCEPVLRRRSVSMAVRSLGRTLSRVGPGRRGDRRRERGSC